MVSISISRAAFHAKDAMPNLGVLPPLALQSSGLPFDRRSVNKRWLAATALVGLGGALMLGLAIIASVDLSKISIFLPELAGPDAQRETKIFDGSAQRGDRLVPLVDNVSARQMVRLPTPIRIGDREIMRFRPFVRVSTKLATNLTGAVGNIPVFNPQKIFAAGGPELDKGEQPLVRADENEAYVQKKPLTASMDPQGASLTLSDVQIEDQVEEVRLAALTAARLTSLTPGSILAPQQMLARTLPLGGTPDQATARRDAVSDTTFSNIRVTVAPENVTTIPMRFIKGPDAPPPNEKFIIAKRNDTLAGLFEANGIAPADARNAVATIASKIKDGIIRDGQKLKILTQPNDNKTSPATLMRAIIYDEDRALAAIVRNDRGQLIPINPPVTAQSQPAQTARRSANDDDSNGVSIYQSLYETGARNDIPRAVIEQLMKVFFFDIDLQREVSAGDQLELFYNDDEERDARKEVLYAALTIEGGTKRYYRFQNSHDGTIDHFDEAGRSNRRFLLRKPITEGIFRSGFGLRYHPILHYSKMHTGVDWADKIGTPIIAAGDGVVIKAEWDSGYGRRVEIQHNYNFVTTYNHLSAFAAGINEGVKVKQGQVIGYLGNSGLSTGPHLHYEVMVNDNYVDPLSIKLPSNKELDRSQMAEFKREKDRIDDLLKQTVVTSGAR
jgi:murein DD-endopeptidase MepM/ murein hydrolase activator NlpD